LKSLSEKWVRICPYTVRRCLVWPKCSRCSSRSPARLIRSQQMPWPRRFAGGCCAWGQFPQ